MFSSSSTNTPLSSYPFSSSPFLVLESSSTINRSSPPNFVARLIISSTSKRSKDSAIPKQPISPSKPSKKELKERAAKREGRSVTISSVEELEGRWVGFGRRRRRRFGSREFGSFFGAGLDRLRLKRIALDDFFLFNFDARG